MHVQRSGEISPDGLPLIRVIVGHSPAAAGLFFFSMPRLLMDRPARLKTQWMLIAAGLASLAVWLYWPTLGHTVVWDDFPYLVDSSRYWDAGRIPQLFFEPFGLSHAYYRPLALATFALYPVTAEGGQTIHHAINVAIHAVNCALLFLLLASVTHRPHDAVSDRRALVPLWPALATLIFATHPVMIEGVAWLSGRFDVLMTFFLVAAMLFDRLVTHAIIRAMLVGCAAFLALLCKESVVGWIAALPLVHLAARSPTSQSGISFARATWSEHRLTYVVVGFALLCYLALRIHALGEIKPLSLGTWQGEPIDRLVVALITSWKYAAMTVFPWSYAGPLQPFDFSSARSAANLVPAALGALLAVCAVVAVVLPRARAFLPISVWLVALWPVLNLVSFPNGETIVADRYLMLPILTATYTFFLVTASSRAQTAVPGRAGRQVLALMAAAWIAASVAVVNITIPFWRDNFTFWSFVLQRHPTSATALGNLGREYLLRGELPQAETHLAKSFQLRPNLANSVNLAFVLALQGDMSNARNQIALIPQDIVGASPANERAMLENTLGWLEDAAGNLDAARRHFLKALELDPTLWKARLNLAETLVRAGEHVAAEQQLALLAPNLTAEGQARLVAVRAMLHREQSAPPAPR